MSLVPICILFPIIFFKLQFSVVILFSFVTLLSQNISIEQISDFGWQDQSQVPARLQLFFFIQAPSLPCIRRSFSLKDWDVSTLLVVASYSVIDSLDVRDQCIFTGWEAGKVNFGSAAQICVLPNHFPEHFTSHHIVIALFCISIDVAGKCFNHF